MICGAQDGTRPKSYHDEDCFRHDFTFVELILFLGNMKIFLFNISFHNTEKTKSDHTRMYWCSDFSFTTQTHIIEWTGLFRNFLRKYIYFKYDDTLR